MWQLPGLNDDSMFMPQGPQMGFDPNVITGLSQQTNTPSSPFKYTPFNKAGGVGNYLGANMPLISGGLQGLGKLGELYLGIKQLSLAKDSFKLNKRAYETNLTNSTQSYNTQVGDRIAGRSYATEEERQAALRAAQLPMLGA